MGEEKHTQMVWTCEKNGDQSGKKISIRIVEQVCLEWVDLLYGGKASWTVCERINK